MPDQTQNEFERYRTSHFEQQRRRESKLLRDQQAHIDHEVDEFIRTCSREDLELFRELAAKQDEKHWHSLGKILRSANPATSPRIRAFIHENILTPKLKQETPHAR